ncbi:hypothetical protein [Bradyrhizobium ottawaense]|uniref:hypothetical protein n=1 Tax=Bradyrhizobium ottawaense TaxID=931866 RepID=UPI001178CB6B|nr:hypothetical protein [Bradyrhizobium ottawaense]
MIRPVLLGPSRTMLHRSRWSIENDVDRPGEGAFALFMPTRLASLIGLELEPFLASRRVAASNDCAGHKTGKVDTEEGQSTRSGAHADRTWSSPRTVAFKKISAVTHLVRSFWSSHPLASVRMAADGFPRSNLRAVTGVDDWVVPTHSLLRIGLSAIADGDGS